MVEPALLRESFAIVGDARAGTGPRWVSLLSHDSNLSHDRT